MSFQRLLVLALLSLPGSLPLPALSEELLGPDVQAAILKKLLAYDSAISGPPHIAIAFAKEYSAVAKDTARALEHVNLSSTTVPITEFADKAPGIQVVLVIAPALPPAGRALCAREHVLSVSPMVSMAERGEVAVALGARSDGRPEIVVNLVEMGAVGHTLSSALLGLARVVH